MHSLLPAEYAHAAARQRTQGAQAAGMPEHGASGRNARQAYLSTASRPFAGAADGRQRWCRRLRTTLLAAAARSRLVLALGAHAPQGASEARGEPRVVAEDHVD
jgi:hypothetical protein